MLTTGVRTHGPASGRQITKMARPGKGVEEKKGGRRRGGTVHGCLGRDMHIPLSQSQVLYAIQRNRGAIAFSHIYSQACLNH